jgi:peptidyl-tRNA hydrolase
MYAIFARETLQQMKYEGKLAAQAGHAFLHAYWDAEDRFKFIDGVPSPYYRNTMLPYRQNMDARKITLVVDTIEELEELYFRFRPFMGATLVEDCGYTVFDSDSTITAVGLGPISNDWVKDSYLSQLETLKNEIHNEY